MKSLPKVLAGLVVGLILGATLTLAVQSRGEQLDNSPVRASNASPTPPGEPEAPATFLAWVPGGLPPGFTRSVANLPSIDRITAVAEDNVWMTRSWSSDGALVDHPTGPYAIPIDAAAVSPRSFRAFLPPPDRAVVAALADGQGVLGATSAELRGLGPGAELAFEGGTRIRIVDVLPDELVGAAELLVSKATGATIGVHRERYLLLQPHDGGSLNSAELRARLRPLLPADLGIYRHVQVRAPGETPFFRSGDAVLPPVMIKALFGEFAARPSPGRPGYLDVDPAWVRAHIVTVQVPLLGDVTCNRALIPPAPRRDVVAPTSRARLPDRFVCGLLRAEVREPRPHGDALAPRVGHRVRLQLRGQRVRRATPSGPSPGANDGALRLHLGRHVHRSRRQPLRVPASARNHRVTGTFRLCRIVTNRPHAIGDAEERLRMPEAMTAFVVLPGEGTTIPGPAGGPTAIKVRTEDRRSKRSPATTGWTSSVPRSPYPIRSDAREPIAPSNGL